MTYKIVSTRQVNEVLFTTVECNFGDKLHTIEIPHFMPKSQEEIEQNIINASQSEFIKLQSIDKLKSLILTLPINEVKTIE